MIVKDVSFQVNGQTIKFSTAAQLVANSAGIVTASFSFSTDWSEYEIIKVIFSNGDTKKSKILTTGQYTVAIPSECLTAGRLLVSAVGLSGDTGEETFKRATTERNNGVEVVPSGAFEGSPAELPTPTEAEEILLIATNANATAAQANTTANTANLNASSAVLTANTADAKAQTALDKLPYIVMGNTIYGGTIADNLNTIVKSGFYTCYGSSIGAPGTTTSWFVIHQNSNAGTITASQRATAFSTELIVYERTKISNTWQPWKRFPDTRYKGLRLARQIILTGTAATIEFNTDSDGNALNSTLGGELLFYSGTNTSITTVISYFMQLNNVTTGYWDSNNSSSVSILTGYCGSLFGEGKVMINNVNQNIIINSSYAYRTSSSGATGVRTGGMSYQQSSITSIKLIASSDTFPAGTVVEWWERG